jgi:hypothetical protein
MATKFFSPVNFGVTKQLNIALELFRRALESWLNTLGVLKTWGPTLTNMSQGNGTVTARYCQIGKTVFGYFVFVLGSTSTVGTSPQISLPVTVSSSWNNLTPIGSVNLLDTGTAVYYGLLRPTSTTAAIFYVQNSAGTYVTENGITATVPMTWTTGDAFACSFKYEAA